MQRLLTVCEFVKPQRERPALKTLRFAIDAANPDSEPSRSSIERAAGILRSGGLIAFPTETVYGLGACALDREAVGKIFAAKDRPAWDPLIVHVAGWEMLKTVVEQPVSETARRMMSAFWPGPLTLLLPRTGPVPDIVTAGRPLVGVRMPAHPIAHALIAAAGVPVVAPSANRFGRISPTLANHVLEDLDGRIDAILDGGEATHGLESTVIDASQAPVVLYRPGVITAESIRAVCGEVVQWTPSQDRPKGPPESMPSPGVGIRHYAPRARLVTVEEQSGAHSGAFLQAVEDAVQAHSRIGVLLPTGHPDEANVRAIAKIIAFGWGNWSEPEQLAHNLFAGLRALDHAGVDIIVCPLPSAHGIGAAIRDRLLKGAKL